MTSEPPYVPEDDCSEEREAAINGVKMFIICVTGQEDMLFYADRSGKVYGDHGHQYGTCSKKETAALNKAWDEYLEAK